MGAPLTKSSVNTCNSGKPFEVDLVFRKLFDVAKERNHKSMLVNMDTRERLTNLDILVKAEKYEKGLLTLGLEPGVDSIAVIGCVSFEALAVFAAAVELGYGFTQHFFHPPRYHCMDTQLGITTPKVVFIGEGAGGRNFDALLEFFETDAEKPSSEKFPFVEHIFYDSSYDGRSPLYKFIRTFDKLLEHGKTVSDEALLEAKLLVRPDFAVQHFFTSGSTGSPKCVTYTQSALANYIEANKPTDEDELSPIIMNMNLGIYPCSIALFFGLIGMYKKLVMVPESYAGKPVVNQGELLATAMIDEKINLTGLTMSELTSVVDYLKDENKTLPLPVTVPYGGQLISKQFILENKKLLKGPYIVGYGMTEVGSIAVSDWGCTDAKLCPVAGLELRIVNNQDKAVDIGVIGEIQVRSPLVMKEYRNKKYMTEELFTDDKFFKTGDMAVMMEDGSFKIKGRELGLEKFVVPDGGEYAGSLEEIFNEHPKIRHTYAVSGKLNNWMGDEITCCIEMKSGKEKLSEEELLKFCKQKGMSKEQTPARIIYFEKFPMTDTGAKVSKLYLTSQVQAMVAEDEELGKCEWFRQLERSRKDKLSCVDKDTHS